MFNILHFLNASNLSKTVAMLFTMVIIISLLTVYVYADAWDYTNNPSRFQINYSYNLYNLSFSNSPWGQSQMPTWSPGTNMPQYADPDWLPGTRMPPETSSHWSPGTNMPH